MDDDARSVLDAATQVGSAPRPTAAPQSKADIVASLRALMLVRSYRVRGHLEAHLDPLGLQAPKPHPELDPRSYGFTEADWDRGIFIDNVLGRESATLREIVNILRETYCEIGRAHV